jgi:sterol desaturase/sphingolipid hydroxylase (fatty acid hydroxylase superfamily)
MGALAVGVVGLSPVAIRHAGRGWPDRLLHRHLRLLLVAPAAPRTHFEFFHHTNIRTPRWVGWFFQRPEMHRIHHQLGRHKNNYGDITWWDMLFGIYENPAEWVHRCGFDADREQQLLKMLAYQDVHE